MPSQTSETQVLIRRVEDGDEGAMVELFAVPRPAAPDGQASYGPTASRSA